LLRHCWHGPTDPIDGSSTSKRRNKAIAPYGPVRPISFQPSELHLSTVALRISSLACAPTTVKIARPNSKRRMEKGNPGDAKSVGQGILEMRIDYGPGYRIYYVHRGAQIVILLCGGDKRSQQQDIKRAQKLAETL
jgi:putative addiction module killer protein